MNLIVDDIRSQFNAYPEAKLVVTGLDRCGKSYFVNKYFPEYSVYHSCGKEFYDVASLYWEYKIFDRHPLIETYVYMTGFPKNKPVTMALCREDLLKYKHSVFVFFLNPRYRDKRADEFDLSGGDKCFTEMYHEVAMMIKDNVEGSIVIEILPNQLRRYTNE